MTPQSEPAESVHLSPPRRDYPSPPELAARLEGHQVSGRISINAPFRRLMSCIWVWWGMGTPWNLLRRSGRRAVRSPIGDRARVRAYPAASLDAWCGKQRPSGFVGEPPDASALLLEDPSSTRIPDGSQVVFAGHGGIDTKDSLRVDTHE